MEWIKRCINKRNPGQERRMSGFRFTLGMLICGLAFAAAFSVLSPFEAYAVYDEELTYIDYVEFDVDISLDDDDYIDDVSVDSNTEGIEDITWSDITTSSDNYDTYKITFTADEDYRFSTTITVTGNGGVHSFKRKSVRSSGKKLEVQVRLRASGDGSATSDASEKAKSSTGSSGVTAYIDVTSTASNTAGSWSEEDDGWYFLNNNSKVTGWISWNGNWYYCDPNDSGRMATGWQYITGYGYYLDPANGGAMATGWVQDTTGTWYYMDPETGRAASGWIQDDTSYYYINTDGSLFTGWLLDNGYYYYLDPSDGGARATGWVVDNGRTYYFNGKGRMQTGWIKVSGVWYYMDETRGDNFGALTDYTQ